jgi:pyruvate dehydrogenase E1 component
MPDFWQFPTVSMGLGPLMAIYQARFLKYLHGRGLADTENRKVWAFMGDGEMDEPESLGAISLAGREHLDNLVFVINCNLQRLDGPVRGNGKIIQELESGVPRRRLERHQGAVGPGLGCRLLAKDKSGKLLQADGRMRRWRVPGLQEPRAAPTCASTSSAATRNRHWSPT